MDNDSNNNTQNETSKEEEEENEDANQFQHERPLQIQPEIEQMPPSPWDESLEEYLLRICQAHSRNPSPTIL